MYQLIKVKFETYRDFENEINNLRAKKYFIVQIIEFKDATINDKGTATILYEQK